MNAMAGQIEIRAGQARKPVLFPEATIDHNNKTSSNQNKLLAYAGQPAEPACV